MGRVIGLFSNHYWLIVTASHIRRVVPWRGEEIPEVALDSTHQPLRQKRPRPRGETAEEEGESQGVAPSKMLAAGPKAAEVVLA